MKKLVLAVLAALSAVPAFAKVQNLTVQNDSNREIVCAYVVWDQPANKYITWHWFPIANGGVGTARDVSYIRCEDAQNPEAALGNQRNFCVTRNPRYVNPFHNAQNFNTCQQFGGEWRGFNQLPNLVSHTFHVNP